MSQGDRCGRLLGEGILASFKRRVTGLNRRIRRCSWIHAINELVSEIFWMSLSL